MCQMCPKYPPKCARGMCPWAFFSPAITLPGSPPSSPRPPLEHIPPSHDLEPPGRHKLLHSAGSVARRHIHLHQDQPLISRADCLGLAHAVSPYPLGKSQADGPPSIGADRHMSIRAQTGQLGKRIKEFAHASSIANAKIAAQVNRIFDCSESDRYSR